MSKNVVPLKSGSEVTQGNWTLYHSIDCVWFPISVLYSNFVPKTRRFWDIRHLSIQWPWNPGWGSLKVIENYPIQSGTHDFVLTFHRNRRPISHRFRDKRRCTSKITRQSPIFPPHVYLTPPLKGFPVEFCIGAGSQETRMMGLTWWSKKFSDRFSSFDTIPECDSHPASHVASCRSKYRAHAQVTSSADAVKPARRVWRSVKVTKHSTILYVRYSFLLCNSNFVFKTRRFYDIRLQIISWPWNGGQRSLKVIESDIIR